MALAFAFLIGWPGCGGGDRIDEDDPCSVEGRYGDGRCDPDCVHHDQDCDGRGGGSQHQAPRDVCETEQLYADGVCHMCMHRDPDCNGMGDRGRDPCEQMNRYGDGRCDLCPRRDPDCGNGPSPGGGAPYGDPCQDLGLYGDGKCHACPNRDPDCDALLNPGQNPNTPGNAIRVEIEAVRATPNPVPRGGRSQIEVVASADQPGPLFYEFALDGPGELFGPDTATGKVYQAPWEQAGTETRIEVQVRHPAGTEVRHVLVLQLDTEPPLAAPTGLSARFEAGEIVLSWQAVPMADRYQVRASVHGIMDLHDVSGTSFRLALPPAQVSEFSVRALQQGQPGAWSDTVRVTAPPRAPAQLDAKLRNDGSVEVSWGAVSGAERYAVYRSKPASELTALATVSTPSHVDPGPFVAGEQWQYAVRALDAIGQESPLSGTRLVTILENYTHVLTFGELGSALGQLDRPRHAVVDPTPAGGPHLLVADFGNSRVSRFDMSGKHVASFGQGRLDGCRGIAVDAEGNVYVASTNSHRVVKFGPDGSFITQFGSKGTGNGQFEFPSGLAVDADGNQVFVLDLTTTRVQKFTRAQGTENYSFSLQLGSQGGGPGKFHANSRVTSLATTLAGDRVYVVEEGQHAAIEVFDGDGTFVRQMMAASYPNYRGIATDASGHIYLLVSTRVRKYASDGTLLANWLSHAPRGLILGLSPSPDGSNVFLVDHKLHQVQCFEN